MKVVHLSPATETILSRSEVIKQANEMRNKQAEKRLRKKYKLDGTMESSSRLPRLRG